MKRLEYLSGFSIGHVIDKILIESDEDLISIVRNLHMNYSQLWEMFHEDEVFFEGLKKGLQVPNLPELTEILIAWFNELTDHLNHKIHQDKDENLTSEYISGLIVGEFFSVYKPRSMLLDRSIKLWEHYYMNADFVRGLNEVLNKRFGHLIKFEVVMDLPDDIGIFFDSLEKLLNQEENG